RAGRVASALRAADCETRARGRAAFLPGSGGSLPQGNVGGKSAALSDGELQPFAGKGTPLRLAGSGICAAATRLRPAIEMERRRAGRLIHHAGTDRQRHDACELSVFVPALRPLSARSWPAALRAGD